LEQDHRFIKRRVNPGLGFKSFNTARRTIQGYEIINIIRKGQVVNIKKGVTIGQKKFIESLFEIAI
jgi:transposase-like protein